MSRTAEIIWKSIGIGIATALLVTAVVFGYLMRPTDAPCASLNYIIEDREERMYLSEEELNQILRSAELYPVGQAQNMLSLHCIEQTMLHHPMVRTAECYLTPRHEMQIRLTQRVPLLRVQTPAESFLIDTDRRVMESRVAVKDSVLMVTGSVGVQLASTQMADFARWLQKNKYWRERIESVRVQTPQMIYLNLKGQQPRVVLGSMRHYERKLKKLRTFLEEGQEATAEKEYKEWDVRFKGQVIGRR